VALEDKDRVLIFNVARGAKSFHEVRKLDGQKAGAASSVCLSPNGDRLAAEIWTGFLCLWDLKNGREIWFARTRGNVLNLTFSPDGESLYFNEANGLVRCWNTATGRERITSDTPSSVNLAAPSADGRHIATTGEDGQIQRWDAKTGKRLAAWKAHENRIDLLTFAAKQLISVAGEHKDSRWERKVGWWDISSGRRVQVARKNQLAPALISANGSTWVVRDRATYHFHDAAGKERGCVTLNVRDHSEDAGNQFEAAISPDGRQFAAYDHESRLNHASHLTLWDVESTPRCLLSLGIVSRDRVFHEHAHIGKLAFSPDGRLLAGVREHQQVEIVHTGSGNRKLRVEGGALAFSPDGLWLATGGSTGEIGICAAESGGFIMRRSGHQDAITQLHFARSIRTLLSVSADRTALMWSLRPDLPNPLPKPDALWADLASPDAAKAKAYGAFWGFIEQPESASFLAERLRTAQKEFDPAKIRKWLAELDDRSFPVRDTASAALARLGPAIEPALRLDLESATTAEKRQRLNKLLDAFGVDRPPDQLRLLRAVSALAEIGTPQAKKALQDLAKADDLAPLAADAKAALQRITD
jgi:WD40 repeat protein